MGLGMVQSRSCLPNQYLRVFVCVLYVDLDSGDICILQTSEVDKFVTEIEN